MLNDVTVRPAGPSEIELARDLTNRSWVNTYSPLIGEQVTRGIIEDRHSAGRFHEQAERAQSKGAQDLFLIAERNGQIVGHCYTFEDDGCFVDRLHVDPELKGGGIGRAMLAYVENEQPAGTRIWLDVLRGNDAAIAFYRRVGFTAVGETGACGGLAGIPAVIFEKTVKSPGVEPC